MGSKITGKEYSLHKIFGQDFEYHIPAYQRPYAWSTEETGVLFDDLYEFYQSEHSGNYFLGTIVLIKEEDKPECDVIDGQQRLTTLTILFSTLANQFKFHNDARNSCNNLLQESGDILAGIPAKPRMHLRDRDQAFFQQYIQEVKIDALLQLDTASLTEVQRHIQENCKTLLERFETAFNQDEDRLIEFSQFLLKQCFLVAVTTDSQESAFRVFSVMNSRGLDLLPIDIIKSKVIGEVPQNEQDIYTQKWEDLENMAGRDGFNEVFTHTRTIFAKERPKKNLLEEFQEHVLKGKKPEELIDTFLAPYAEAYVILKNSEYIASSHAEEVNDTLYWLNKIEDNDWMPSAIKFMAEHKDEPEYILWFIKKLERLSSYLYITKQDINHRIERYKRVLAEMESRPDHDLSGPLTSVELTIEEKKRFYQALDDKIYTKTPRRRNYIVQRLDSFVSDGGARYDKKQFTIEHVLPQHPAKDGEWDRLWPEQETRDYWCDRIANLVPLTKGNNSSAQNYDFAVKKRNYFQAKNGTTSYSLTAQIINIDSWTPEVVKKRQEELLKIFSVNWELASSALNSNTANSSDTFYLATPRGCNAYGHTGDDSTFIVEKGSHISPDTTPSCPPTYINLRDDLIKQCIIIDNIFRQDYPFTSPSAAASVVTGSSSNGPQKWKTVDGRTYSEVSSTH
ncbi:DUF4357 domain-containing protein [Pseudoflavonifractor sp. MSJ-37]|uniref:DUF4357 domain-containing protein n=1 Tax=Pseudoflavonifractor sp. MSJ-37 TaxID=2841531 RepID=UPI001C0FA3FC|nr:DUF4357 domain-containing protein [Pseudoflavonifractor sp. MSJ-37]MBU5435172.1 DUF4357 domain-containing protein [Pseudoflavonifractor sp. MSJ-37]